MNLPTSSRSRRKNFFSSPETLITAILAQKRGIILDSFDLFPGKENKIPVHFSILGGFTLCA